MHLLWDGMEAESGLDCREINGSLWLIFSLSSVGYVCMSESYKPRGHLSDKINNQGYSPSVCFLNNHTVLGVQAIGKKYQLSEYTEGFNRCC